MKTSSKLRIFDIIVWVVLCVWLSASTSFLNYSALLIVIGINQYINRKIGAYEATGD